MVVNSVDLKLGDDMKKPVKKPKVSVAKTVYHVKCLVNMFAFTLLNIP